MLRGWPNLQKIWDHPDRGKIKDDLLREMLGDIYSELAVDAALAKKLYVDGTNGDDSNTGLTWNAALKTLEAAWPKVPMFGWTYVYVKGTVVIGDAVVGLPYDHYFGCLRIIGADDWEEVATGTVTTYTNGAGRYESDTFDLDLGVYSKADATDRKLWVEVVDDGGNWRLRKIIEYDYASSGVYDVEDGGSYTITAGNACKLVRPTTTINITNSITGPYGLQGSVWIVGCKVVAPNKTYPSKHVGFAACDLDFSLPTYALFFERASGLGTLTTTSGAHGKDFFGTMPEAAVAGTYLENKGGTTSRYPGCYLLMKATGMCNFGGNRRNQWLALFTVFDSGIVELGYGLIYANFQNCRGISTDVSVFTGAQVYWQINHFPDGLLTVATNGGLWHWGGNTFGAAAVQSGVLVGWGSSVITLERAAGNVVGALVGSDGFVEDTEWGGGFDVSSGATPLVQVEGRAKNMSIGVTGVDRGVGPLVLVTDSAMCEIGPTCSGDNSNAGGYGLEVRNQARADVPAGHALTGNGSGTTTAYLGSIGATGYPASGNLLNDISGTTGTQEFAVLSVR
jgi:hypothetical protein